jgi:hypothetical protein
MIGHWAAFGRGRCADIAALKVRDLGKPTNLAIEECTFRRGEILA